MQLTDHQSLPLITVGIVVYNRAWIIKKMLASLQHQTYPHDKLYVVMVDGGSKDNTVEAAEDMLSTSDFLGYKIIVEKSNIPEARNLCIKNMSGDFLLFWDSDIIVESTAVASMFEAHRKENADIVFSCIQEVSLESLEEIVGKCDYTMKQIPREPAYLQLNLATTGHILISKKVTDQVDFDPDLTFSEDRAFSSKASQKGFKIIATRKSVGVDVNLSSQPYSNIYGLDMSLKEALRGLGKKGKFQAQGILEESDASSSKAFGSFFLKNKRYLTYLAYPPVLALSILGVVLPNYVVALIFPAYFLILASAQLASKGLKLGLKAAIRSFIVGVPTTYALLYYCIKYSIKKPNFTKTLRDQTT
jgi:glycosyltransferase involved in cell wall biosynthesis